MWLMGSKYLKLSNSTLGPGCGGSKQYNKHAEKKKDLDVVPSRAGLGLVPSKADPTLFGPSLLSFILHFKISN